MLFKEVSGLQFKSYIQRIAFSFISLGNEKFSFYLVFVRGYGTQISAQLSGSSELGLFQFLQQYIVQTKFLYPSNVIQNKKTDDFDVFFQVNEAYSVLSDPQKKARYDRGEDLDGNGFSTAGIFIKDSRENVLEETKHKSVSQVFYNHVNSC